MTPKPPFAPANKTTGSEAPNSTESATFESDDPVRTAQKSVKAPNKDQVDRRAAALRANLRRRKDQNRARRSTARDESPEN